MPRQVDSFGGTRLKESERRAWARGPACAALAFAVLLMWPLSAVHAQPDFDDMDDVGDDDDDDSGDDDDAATTVAPTAETPATSMPTQLGEGDVLVCDGGWRYPLVETREEIGPARFARQLELQKDLQFTSKAFAYCANAASSKFEKQYRPAAGPCAGLIFLADRVDVAAANLFRLEDTESCECLTKPVEAGGRCEGLREQLTTLRRYDNLLVQRAELVLAAEVCASPERNTNFQLRAACRHMDRVLGAHYKPGAGQPGQFSLSAPLPGSVAGAVRRISKATDGRYLSVLPENFIGVRQSLCKLPIQPVTSNQCTTRTIEPPPDFPKGQSTDVLGPQSFAQKMAEVTWGMCNELALADVNAATCRDADVYIDERGQLHLNRPLTTSKQRQNATLCVDISDFDQRHPLMVTLGMDPTDSVPKRLWPGETMRIGQLLRRSVTREDVLRINVLGKARGVSLSEVLRVNGIQPDAVKQYEDDACRIAKSWVPVVDHEVPIGDPGKQAIIPVRFDRGRDGETREIFEGDYVLLWIRDIEPSRGVLVEYADGQLVGYEPPPLLGMAPNTPPSQGGISSSINPMVPGNRLRGGILGVGAPLLPRRARYPGSRVLRLGSPNGSQAYNLRVCKPSEAVPITSKGTCAGDGANMLLDEKLFVHGDSTFGVKLYFGYSFFPIEQLQARRTPAAIESGQDGVHEVVKVSDKVADYDVAALLAVYPFGRNPRRFSYNPLSRDYWKSAALLAGFSVRTLTPWEDFYLGASLPVASGVSATLMSHLSRRSITTGVQEGQLINGSDLSGFPKDTVIAVGVTAGLSFDLDLFERAFFNVWNRVRGKTGTFLSATGGSGGDTPYDYD